MTLRQVFMIFISLLTPSFFLFPASAQSASSDALFCQTLLDLLQDGRAEEVVAKQMSRQTITASEEAKYVNGVKVGLQLLSRKGGGLPQRVDYSADVRLPQGDIARINIWRFPNGLIGDAGCVRYVATNGVKSTVVLVDNEINSLESALDHYAGNHLVPSEN